MFESSEAKQEGDASQEQDDDPITLFQPAANRQVPGQMPQHARFTPRAAPTAEQSSQSAPDVTGALSAPVHQKQQPITAWLKGLLLKQGLPLIE